MSKFLSCSSRSTLAPHFLFIFQYLFHFKLSTFRKVLIIILHASLKMLLIKSVGNSEKANTSYFYGIDIDSQAVRLLSCFALRVRVKVVRV